MRRSLRSKIIIWSFVPTAIILGTVALVSLYAYQQVTGNLAIERDREMTRLSARLLANDLAAYTDPLAVSFLTTFDGVIVFGEDGTILATQPKQYEKWRSKWSEEIARYQRSYSDDPVFSDIMVEGLEGEKFVIVVMAAQGSQAGPSGGIAGLFRLGPSTDSTLNRSIESLRRGDNTQIYLVDGKGRVIYHSAPEYIGQDFAKYGVVEMVQQGWAGAFRTEDLDGQEIVASFSPVPGTSWGLVTEESWDELNRSSRRYGQFLLLLLVLGLAFPMIIVTVGVRRITQPIAELIGAAQEIAGGRFGRRIEASSGDELEDLAAQFNLMASRLQESYAHLEGKVANRTRELSTLNTIAAEVSRSLDLERIMNNALDEVLEVMDMECGQAFRLEEETETLVLVAHRGLSEEFVQGTSELPLSASLAAEAARTGQPAVQRLPDYAPGELWSQVSREGIQLISSVPLMVHGRSVGAIHVGSRKPRIVTPEEIALLAAIGNQIGVAVENARLYEQAQQLAVMKERNRLARDLHDSVTQALYGISLYSEAAARQLQVGDRELATRHLREIRETAQESLREMRLLIFELRLPMLQEDGLAPALQARLETVEGRVGIETRFRVELDGRLSPKVEEGLYRIAQEALNNALHHADAQSVSVCLLQNGRTVTLEVTDDGVGFDPSATGERSGFGLRGMRERATRLGGTLEVFSSLGEGTRIKVEVNYD